MLRLLAGVLLASSLTAEQSVVFRSHSHNDYLQPVPLEVALTHQMGSVEADVWWLEGELRIGHRRDETRPGWTLPTCYLEPLRARIAASRGAVYPDGPALMLLIDIKSDGDATLEALKRELADYQDLLTRFGDQEEGGAVTIVLSGNVPRSRLAAQGTRLVACDGRPIDLTTKPPRTLVPLISDDWRRHFSWDGRGSMPAAEQRALRELVTRCHAQGRKLRLWAAPDTEESWREQLAAGVDYINTDQPSALHTFLASEGTPTAP